MSQEIARNAINLDDYTANNNNSNNSTIGKHSDFLIQQESSTQLKLEMQETSSNYQNYANMRDEQKLRARETIKLQM
jgi:hypothetical protein